MNRQLCNGCGADMGSGAQGSHCWSCWDEAKKRDEAADASTADSVNGENDE